ncbi:thioredoxin-like [Xenia sp. Carnegie-2017]|uniref:thioredoxin-like n=1 Tax=Xenia sp. Carnegie-2017 TaxID=2897299 RepID=UPI001F049B7E|nr:thioredoxin-like [Xenia sp. Carnegie-2017]
MVRFLETKADFDSFLKANKDKLVAIDFTAAWCGPCKIIGPVFEKLHEDFPNIVLAKVDVDENEETAAHCGISAMPTFQLYIDEKKIDSMTGANADKLKALVAKYYK